MKKDIYTSSVYRICVRVDTQNMQIITTDIDEKSIELKNTQGISKSFNYTIYDEVEQFYNITLSDFGVKRESETISMM